MRITDELSKQVWKAMTWYAGERGIVYITLHFGKEVLFMTEPTVKSRLKSGQWTHQELKKIVHKTNHEGLINYIANDLREGD